MRGEKAIGSIGILCLLSPGRGAGGWSKNREFNQAVRGLCIVVALEEMGWLFCLIRAG